MLLNRGVGEDSRVPWTTRKWSQSILKEISPGCSLEGLMLKLKLQSFGTWCEDLTHSKRPWCWERLKEGVEGDSRGWHGWMTSPTRWTQVSANSGSWCWTGRPGMLQPMGSQRVEHHWATELNWTECTSVAQIALPWYFKWRLEIFMTLLFFFFFCHTTWHVGSLVPDQGLNPCPSQGQHWVLTPGPTGKSPSWSFSSIPPQHLLHLPTQFMNMSLASQLALVVKNPPANAGRR